MYIDTHCHLNMMINAKENVPLSCEDLNAIKPFVDDAYNENVKAIITVGTGIIDSHNAIKLAQHFPNVWATVGVHPCDEPSLHDQDIQTVLAPLHNLLKEKKQNKIVAIGEIGLDFYHKPFDAEQQAALFKAQIELALLYDLPIAVHVREAGEQVFAILQEYQGRGLRGVIHCFLQSLEFAQTVIDWGFFIGIDAPITYPKNDILRDTIKQIRLERIILETDAPFLPPQIFRGKQNKPAYIPLIAKALADVKHASLNTIEDITTQNACDLFGISY